MLGWKGLQAATVAANHSGLIYTRARCYDPALGRFASEDPAGLAGGINQYALAGDDSINAGDPSGMCPVAAVFEAIVSGQLDFSSLSSFTCTDLPPVKVTGKQDDPFGRPEPTDPPRFSDMLLGR